VAFQSLYRKYRPQRFDELVGQDHVTTALRNAVREGRVGHAYLFSGPRGTGKTTTARILAKALNCLNLGTDGEPDGTCENCVAIAAGSFNDLVEMDAASNNGVDAIRDLVERVSLGIGATSKVKVYLVDEVHMLSNAASNALLKTLEEPPGHVVFVLATTNPEKVLPTIRSRTQHFELTLLSMDQITGLLASLLDREGVEFEPEALTPIARAAGGSARDAESLLDQALAHATGALTVAEVESVLGGSPFDARMAILDAIAAEDVAGALTGLARLLESGHDARRIAEDLLRSLRDAFLLSAARGQVHVEAPEEERDRLRSIGEVLGNAAIVRGLETLGHAVVDMRGTDAADPRLVVEIALVRLARRDAGTPLQALAERVDRLERGAGAPAVSTPAPTPATSAPVPAPAVGSEPARPAARSGKSYKELKRDRQAAASPAPDAEAPAADPDPPAPADPPAEVDIDDVVVAWPAVRDALPPATKAAVRDAQPLALDDGVITFGVPSASYEAAVPRFRKEADTIRAALSSRLGRELKFRAVRHDFGADPVAADEPLDEEPPDDEIDLADLVEDGADSGPVDSVTLITQSLGATVVEEVPRD
jgi:DNA polymerase III subunit gamma/tau